MANQTFCRIPKATELAEVVGVIGLYLYDGKLPGNLTANSKDKKEKKDTAALLQDFNTRVVRPFEMSLVSNLTRLELALKKQKKPRRVIKSAKQHEQQTAKSCILSREVALPSMANILATSFGNDFSGFALTVSSILSSVLQQSKSKVKKLRQYNTGITEDKRNPYLTTALKIHDEIRKIPWWKCLSTFSFRRTIYLKGYLGKIVQLQQNPTSITDQDRYDWQVVYGNKDYRKTLEKLAKKLATPLAISEVNKQMQFPVSTPESPETETKVTATSSGKVYQALQNNPNSPHICDSELTELQAVSRPKLDTLTDQSVTTQLPYDREDRLALVPVEPITSRETEGSTSPASPVIRATFVDGMQVESPAVRLSRGTIEPWQTASLQTLNPYQLIESAANPSSTKQEVEQHSQLASVELEYDEQQIKQSHQEWLQDCDKILRNCYESMRIVLEKYEDFSIKQYRGRIDILLHMVFTLGRLQQHTVPEDKIYKEFNNDFLNLLKEFGGEDTNSVETLPLVENFGKFNSSRIVYIGCEAIYSIVRSMLNRAEGREHAEYIKNLPTQLGMLRTVLLWLEVNYAHRQDLDLKETSEDMLEDEVPAELEEMDMETMVEYPEQPSSLEEANEDLLEDELPAELEETDMETMVEYPEQPSSLEETDEDLLEDELPAELEETDMETMVEYPEQPSSLEETDEDLLEDEPPAKLEETKVEYIEPPQYKEEERKTSSFKTTPSSPHKSPSRQSRRLLESPSRHNGGIGHNGAFFATTATNPQMPSTPCHSR